MNWLGLLLPTVGLGSIVAGVITGLFMFKVNRAQSVKIIAEAEEVSRRTALDEARAALEFAHASFVVVQSQCEDCQTRLTEAENRLKSSEQRMHISEERLHESETRGRRMTHALRAIVRVMDENDPSQVQDAINAARELL